MVTEIVLVQHAAKERLPGDAPLTDLGQKQARRIARLLAEHRWDRLLCSPLLRARQTAQPIGDACGLRPVLDDRLRERMNWGDAEVTQSLEQFLRDWDRATEDRAWQPPAGASSFVTGRRMRALLDDVAVRTPSRILAVTHGGATLDLLRDITTDSEIEAFAPGALATGIPNCGLTRLVYDRAWRVDFVAEPALR